MDAINHSHHRTGSIVKHVGAIDGWRLIWTLKMRNKVVKKLVSLGPRFDQESRKTNKTKGPMTGESGQYKIQQLDMV